MTCDSFVVSPGTSVSSTNKTDRYDINELLLKVELNTPTPFCLNAKGSINNKSLSDRHLGVDCEYVMLFSDQVMLQNSWAFCFLNHNEEMLKRSDFSLLFKYSKDTFNSDDIFWGWVITENSIIFHMKPLKSCPIKSVVHDDNQRISYKYANVYYRLLSNFEIITQVADRFTGFLETGPFSYIIRN